MAVYLAIGEVAERSGVAASALRFYEDRGLIRSERAGSGHRRYPRRYGVKEGIHPAGVRGEELVLRGPLVVGCLVSHVVQTQRLFACERRVRRASRRGRGGS